jgi:hypothetical protein
VHVDASGVSLGSILAQPGDGAMDHPIYFSSKKFLQVERNYMTTEREGLAMIYTLVGSQPNFFRLLSKAAYTPCRITTNHCRIVLMDIHLIFAIITIQYRPSFSQLQV